MFKIGKSVHILNKEGEALFAAPGVMGHKALQYLSFPMCILYTVWCTTLHKWRTFDTLKLTKHITSLPVQLNKIAGLELKDRTVRRKRFELQIKF